MSSSDLIKKIILGEITVSQGMMLCKVMYKHLLSEESYQWICRELDSYEKAELLPKYRIVDCVIKVQLNVLYIGKRTDVLDTSYFDDILKGLPEYSSPNKMLVTQSIESIENISNAEGSEVRMELTKNQTDLLKKYYSYPSNCRIERMFQCIRPEFISNIITCVKNKLITILQNEVVSRDLLISSIKSNKKQIFISYGWDDEPHRKWVNILANRLSNYFDVRIDEKVTLGTDLNVFMEQMISTSDRVILILTPKYKEKADNRQNGVGYESVLISSELYNNQGTSKFIPIIRKGSFKDSCPLYLGSRKGLDMTDDNSFEKCFNALVEDIKNN